MEKSYPPKEAFSQNAPSQMTSITHIIPISQSFFPKYPASPNYPQEVRRPPTPILEFMKKSFIEGKLMLKWSFPFCQPKGIIGYELFSFLERTYMSHKDWRKVGYISSLPLPMGCTIIVLENPDKIKKFHFIMRAVDDQARLGLFSSPCSVTRQQYLLVTKQLTNSFQNPSPPIQRITGRTFNKNNHGNGEPIVISSDEDEEDVETIIPEVL